MNTRPLQTDRMLHSLVFLCTPPPHETLQSLHGVQGPHSATRYKHNCIDVAKHSCTIQNVDIDLWVLKLFRYSSTNALCFNKAMYTLIYIKYIAYCNHDPEHADKDDNLIPTFTCFFVTQPFFIPHSSTCAFRAPPISGLGSTSTCSRTIRP